MELNIIHNKEEARFETVIEGFTAFVRYNQVSDNQLAIVSTQVPKALENRGIAAELTKFALEYAKSNKLKVQPICSYTVAYMARHPEYKELEEGSR